MLKRYGKRLATAALVTAAIGMVMAPAIAAGLWWGMPLFGSASYCVSFGGTGGQCTSTAPAGPTTFTGFEAFPADVDGPLIGAGQQTPPTTMYISLLDLGNGPIVVNTTAGAQTIPNLTSLYVENVGNTSTTLTLPAAPVGGQIVRVSLATAQTTSILFAASAGQSCLPACPQTKSGVTAGTTYAWVYNLANTTWYSIQ